MLLAIGQVLLLVFFFLVFFTCRTLQKPLHTHMHKGQLICTYLTPCFWKPVTLTSFPSRTRTLHWAFAPEPRRAGVWKPKINFSEHYCWLQIAFFTCIAVEYTITVLLVLCRISEWMRWSQEHQWAGDRCTAESRMAVMWNNVDLQEHPAQPSRLRHCLPLCHCWQILLTH